MKVGKPFTHANSKINVPATLIGFERSKGMELVGPELDVAFVYAPASGGEELSIYIYRATAGVPAIWFDRAVDSLEARPAFKNRTRLSMPVPFVPPGQSAASGLRAAWTINNSPIRSTALAIVPMGEWLVKFRYSSEHLEAGPLMQRLDQAIAGLGWPTQVPPAGAAVEVVDCTAPLTLRGTARPTKVAGSALVDGLIAASQRDIEAKVAEARPPAAWCRDKQVQSPVPIYRPVGTDDRYLGTLSDSARAVWTMPGFTRDQTESARWTVSIVLAGETLIYGSLDRLPMPGQLAEITKAEPSARVTTWGKREVKIDPAQIK